MDYFRTYVSNTLAGSGNQTFVTPEDPDAPVRSVAFYRLFAEGEYHYSLLYSNVMDSTYSNGAHSRCNLICDQWKILSLKIGVCDAIDAEHLPVMRQVTFDGRPKKTVMPGEFFATDPILLNGHGYLAVELTCSGPMLPTHVESIISGYIYKDGAWVLCPDFPHPSMIGCDRPVRRRIGYIGDSITQGIGTPRDAYTHWNAVLSDKLGKENAYWNLGLGYGRGHDAASDGAWLFKAKQNDIAVVCFGVNDLYQTGDAGQIKADLACIADRLHKAGLKVVMQTVPPFNYSGSMVEKWRDINAFVLRELAQQCELVFDNVPILGDEAPNEMKARYGGHPDETGCALWGSALFDAVKPWLETI